MTAHHYCMKCDKDFVDYDCVDGLRVDGTFYCRECAPLKWVTDDKGKKYIEKSIIRDSRNRSSMWDGEPLYYTTLEEFMRGCDFTNSGKVKIIKEETRPDFTDLFVPVKLSGRIFGVHYNIYIYHNYGKDQEGWYFEGYTFELSEGMEKYLCDSLTEVVE